MDENFRFCAIDDITDLEQRVILLLADGFHSKEIAIRLERKKATVEGYVRILFIKFNVRSRAQLVAAAFRCGLLPADRPRNGDLITSAQPD